jgi:hypothetical protein
VAGALVLILVELLVLVAQVAVVQGQLVLHPELLELQTQAVVAVVKVVVPELVVMAVQALSFFATPAQFNISLVAQ